MLTIQTLESDAEELCNVALNAPDEGAESAEPAQVETVQTDIKSAQDPLKKADVIALVRAKLDELEYKYYYDEEDEKIRTFFALRSRIERAQLLIDFIDDTSYMVRFEAEPRLKPEDIPRAAELVSKMNYSIIMGDYEMDHSNGRLFFKYCINYRGLKALSDELIHYSISYPLDAFDAIDEELVNLLVGPPPGEEDGQGGKVIQFVKPQKE